MKVATECKVNSSQINTGSFVTIWAERTQQSKSDPGAQPSPGAPKQRMTRKGGCG